MNSETIKAVSMLILATGAAAVAIIKSGKDAGLQKVKARFKSKFFKAEFEGEYK